MNNWQTPLSAALCVALVTALSTGGCRREKPNSPAPQPVNVTVQEVAPIEQFTDSFVIPGTVEPNRMVQVCAEVSARIETINGTEGTAVTRGQRLVVLNSELLKAELQRAASGLKTGRLELERMEKLFNRQPPLATQSELDRARNNMAVNQAMYDTAASQLARATIVAPISGQLNTLPMEEGEYAQPGACVAQIVDMETAKVVVDVPERDVAHLNEGDATTVFLDGRSDAAKSIPGRITYISRLADSTALTTRMEISVPNSEGTGPRGVGHALRSGQIVRVKLIRQILPNVIFVPLEAVIPLEKDYRVYVVVDNRAQPRTVTLGMIKTHKVQVVSGLEAGEMLIVKGHQYVGPGQDVAVEPAKLSEKHPDPPDNDPDEPSNEVTR